MSASNTYKLQLVIDDSKIRELEKRLNGAFGGGSPAQKQGGMLGQLFGGGGLQGPLKNLAHLAKMAGLMAGGLMILKKILDFSIKASPIAQSTFKLLETSMMFIFRPIGDVIGLVLRPLAIMLLRWAVPFYKKFLTDTSTQKLIKGDVGGYLIDLLFKNREGSIADKMGTSLAEWFQNLKMPTIDTEAISGVFSNWIANLKLPSIKFSDIAVGGIETFQKTIEWIGKTFKETITPKWQYIKNMFTWLGLVWDNHIAPAWTSFKNLFSGIWSDIDAVVKPLWTMVIGGFDWLKSAWDNFVTPAWSSFIGFFTKIAKDVTDFLTTKWAEFTSAIGKIVQFFIDLPGKLLDAIGRWIMSGGGNSGGSSAPTPKLPTQRDMFPWMKDEITTHAFGVK